MNDFSDAIVRHNSLPSRLPAYVVRARTVRRDDCAFYTRVRARV